MAASTSGSSSTSRTLGHYHSPCTSAEPQETQEHVDTQNTYADTQQLNGDIVDKVLPTKEDIVNEDRLAEEGIVNDMPPFGPSEDIVNKANGDIVQKDTLANQNEDIVDKGVPNGDIMADKHSEPLLKEDIMEEGQLPAKRSKRTRKKPGSQDEVVSHCPMCNQPLRMHELQSHLSWELERLNKFCKKQQKDCSKVVRDLPTATTSQQQPPPATTATATTSSPPPEASSSSTTTTTETTRPVTRRKSQPPPPTISEPPPETEDSPSIAKIISPQLRYNSYLDVRKNRRKRIQARRRRRPGDDEATCPVCNDTIIGSTEEVADHVDACLRQQEENIEDDSVIDIEGEDEDQDAAGAGFVEYEWAGQTRVRASSMLEGSFNHHGYQKPSKCDETEEVDIDEIDETQEFGQPQFHEADIIPCIPDEASELRERRALRQAVLSSTNEASCSTSTDSNSRQRWEIPPADPDTGQDDEQEIEEPTTSVAAAASDVVANCSNIEEADSQVQVINSLKARLKEQEDLIDKSNKFKCLICMETYIMPLVSLVCWHVHCEECWLRSLGAKKVCPQCNVIVTASQLRKIYL